MAKEKAEKSQEAMLEEALVKKDEQPYEVPGNWAWTKPTLFAKQLRGVSYKKKDAGNQPEEGKGLILRAGNLQKGEFITDHDCVYVDKDLIANAQQLKVGDVVVVGSSGSKSKVGKAAQVKKVMKNTSFGAFLTLFRPNEIINKEYYGWFFQSKYYRDMISKLSAGININNIKREHFESLYFPLPPFPEQKRIVKKLSSMLVKLKEAKELIQKAKETFEERRAAILNKAFTGELTKKWREENPDLESAEKLIEILIDQKKKQGKKEKIPTYEEMIIKESEHPYEVPENWEFVRLGKVVQINPPKYKPEIGDDTLCSFVPMKAVSDKLGIIENIEKKPYVKIKNGYTSFKENDVLFAKITPCMENGKAAIAKNLINGFGYGSTEFFVFRCSTIVDNNFLYYLVRSKFFRDLAEPNMTGTVGQRRVPKKYLNSFKFPLPPLEEQKEIVPILENLLDHEDEAKAFIDMEEQIDLLEKSILSKAFRGELGTNDPGDEPAIELLKREIRGQSISP